MSIDPKVRDEMLATVPALRAFAMSLCRDVDRADDLVQTTLLRAWGHIDSFEAGTNMAAWLFTILRNGFNSEYRKHRREVADVDGVYAASLTSPPEQEAHVELEEFRGSLGRLPVEQCEALVLVGASGFSYEQAAEICGCAVGTIKSRVNRARSKLVEIMSIVRVDIEAADTENVDTENVDTESVDTESVDDVAPDREHRDAQAKRQIEMRVL
jgi:RNA polymerase sigma-70 factor (ECF subfamily)